MYFKNNCGHVFVDGSKVIVETDTFKRTTEFYSIFNSSIQMEFNDSIVELEIYSNVKQTSRCPIKRVWCRLTDMQRENNSNRYAFSCRLN